MVNLILILIIAGILFLAGFYIHREKKRGKACIGCPYSGSCSGNCSCHTDS